MSLKRVLALGAYDPAYPRHEILLDGLRAHGVEVRARRLPKNASTLQRVRAALGALNEMRRADCVFIPAFNQTLAPFAWLLARAARVPIVVDYLVGLTDVNEDRATTSGGRAALYRLIDRFNVRTVPTFTDTAAHRADFARLLATPVTRMGVIPVGAKAAWLDAPPLPLPAETLTVGFIGTYIPFQGVEVILHAAALLHAQRVPVRFVLVGGGQTYPHMRQLADALQISNVIFIEGFYPVSQLMEQVARCTILLGVFGAARKTQYVVPNKVFDGLAAGRAVITAQSPALLEFFSPGVHLLTVPPGQPAALAEAVRALVDAPAHAEALARAGAARIRESFTLLPIGAQFKAYLAACSER